MRIKEVLPLIFGIILLFSCETESIEPEPEPTPPGGGNEKPQPEPIIPDGTVLIAGILWDTENTIDYCSYEEAEELVQKAGKRIPLSEEWEAMAKGVSAWDEALNGRWFGEDAELLSESKESFFVPAKGYYFPDSDSYPESGKTTGQYWVNNTKSSGNYYATFNKVTTWSTNWTINTHISLRLVQDVTYK